MNRKSRFLKILMAVITVLTVMTVKVEAASGSVSLSTSASSVTVGSKITVKVTVKCTSGIGGALMYLDYNSSYLTLTSNGAKDNFNTSNGKLLFEASQKSSLSYTFVFTAKKEGNTSIKLRTVNFIDFNDGDDISGYKDEITKKLTIKAKSSSSSSSPSKTPAKAVLSSDASLASLTVEGFKIEEEFASNILNYTVYLPLGTEKIDVKAQASNSKAKVAEINTALKPGWNKLDILCTAEDKSTKTYTLNAYVEELPVTWFDFNNSKLGVVRNTDKLEIPEGFRSDTIHIGSEDETVFTDGHYDLLYLEDENGKRSFYLYDEKTSTVASYRPLKIRDRIMVASDADYAAYPEMEEKFEQATVYINGKSMNGWRYKNSSMSSYQIVRLGDENGNYHLYSYDGNENTIQRYTHEEIPVVDVTPDYTQYYYYGAGGFGFLCLIASLIINRKKKHS